mmetsp:Transcript_3880/g.5605  ORF Transcript_3880/g.5605 Transcript_3880/m.5605 type:complete len:618 (-) Transcript_3880:159-2012(-)
MRQRKNMNSTAAMIAAISIILMAAGGFDVESSRRQISVTAFQHQHGQSFGAYKTSRSAGNRNRLPFLPSCPHQYASFPFQQQQQLQRHRHLVELGTSAVDTLESNEPKTDSQEQTFEINGVVNGSTNNHVNGHVVQTSTNGSSSLSSSMNGATNGSTNGAANGSTQVNGDKPVNGSSSSHAVNGDASTENSETTTTTTTYPWEEKRNDDVPMPTANGGYSHTNASRAKISAANKGKTPWNKGKTRSEETKARIAAGVRAKNRERFLKKLEDLGLTEEEYETQKKEERRKKDAERRARRTENGGYRPTQETRKKISKILKEKWASGEMAERRKVDPDKVRRGFKHSEETRAKISESLKKRWASDPEYRAKMVQKATNANAAEDVKQKISESLRKKWQDPEFRAHMMEKMKGRKQPTGLYDQSHREKISEAMRKKWQDKSYRQKAMDAMARKREEMGIKPKPKSATTRRQRRPKSAMLEEEGGGEEEEEAEYVNGIRVLKPRKATKGTKKKRKVKKTKKKKKIKGTDGSVKAAAAKKKSKKSIKGAKTNTEPKESEGSISRLREERRDLYDLLYADDAAGPSPVMADFALGDENLDEFDPYGLEDGDEDLDGFDPYGLD